MKKILMKRALSVCRLGVSCYEMIDTPMLLVVPIYTEFNISLRNYFQKKSF